MKPSDVSAELGTEVRHEASGISFRTEEFPA